MKKTILVAVAALIATPASAGDWSGIYVGVGASFSEHNVLFPNGTDRVRMSDTTAPGVAEYNIGPARSTRAAMLWVDTFWAGRASR